MGWIFCNWRSRTDFAYVTNYEKKLSNSYAKVIFVEFSRNCLFLNDLENIFKELYPVNNSLNIFRPSWKNRGKSFSDFGISIDCCKPDLTTIKNVVHFVTTGTAKFMFNVGRELFFIPVIMILKMLSNRSDAYIYEQLCAGADSEDHYYR